TPPPDFTPDDEAWAVILSIDFFSSMLPFFDPQKIAKVAPSTMFPILNAIKPVLATFRSKVPCPSLKIQRFLHTVFKAVRALCRGHQELNHKIFLDQAPSPDAAFKAELANANMTLLQKGFVLPKPPPPPVYPDVLELTEDEADEEEVDVPSSDAEPPAKVTHSAKSRDKASGKPVKATSTPIPVHNLRRRREKEAAPVVKTSTSKRKAKPPPQLSPPPEASSSKVTLDDDADRGPATRVEMYEQAVAPSGGWVNSKETPFPAFKKVPCFVVGDFFSPSLYERAILKCIPCINRKIPCGGLNLFSPCVPCKEQHVKCSRSNTTMEHLLLFDSLRPHFGLSPDGLLPRTFCSSTRRGAQHAHYPLGRTRPHAFGLRHHAGMGRALLQVAPGVIPSQWRSSHGPLKGSLSGELLPHSFDAGVVFQPKHLCPGLRCAGLCVAAAPRDAVSSSGIPSTSAAQLLGWSSAVASALAPGTPTINSC
ncbi:hypothetical protein B0H16DRAFT_1653080, partial [Mycena metata]